MGLKLLLHRLKRWAQHKAPSVLHREGELPEAPRPAAAPGDAKQAILILGAESTGTRLLAELLALNGAWGDTGHEQRLDSFDRGLLATCGERLFWRRSLPHDADWPDLDRMLAFLEGFRVQVVITSRSWDFMLQSQVRADHAPGMEAALGRAQYGYQWAFDFVGRHKLPYVVFSYDALLAHPERQQDWLLAWLGIERKQLVQVRDENKKYV